MSNLKCPNIKIYKCSDGFVTDNAQVAKSHEINIKNKKLLCPIHNTELAYLDEGVYGHTGCNMTGNEELWQELILTRKALENAREAVLAFRKRTDIAMCALSEISKQHPDGCNKGWYVGVARKALEQIKTALEQKDK